MSASATKSSKLNPILATSEEGIQLASIPEPAICPGVSRIAVVFKAGSRYENGSENRGITHLLRRSCGLATENLTAVNMTRHFQQMGARVTCTTTREHMIYTVDVASNLASRAGHLLAQLATCTAFYEWELKSITNRLMRKDIDLLHRRNLPGLSTELLYEAAFGLSSVGCGLGHSLIAPADRVGSYSLEQIKQFQQQYMTPTRCSLVVIGNDEQASDGGLEMLDSVRSALHFDAPQKIAQKTGMVHGFVGGDLRRELSQATTIDANLAWPTAGRTNPEQQLALDLVARLLTGVVGRISYGSNATQTQLRGGGKESNTSDDVTIVAYHKAHEDHGLFGFHLHGGSCCSAKSVEDKLTHIVSATKTINVTAEDLAKAKALYKCDLLGDIESPCAVATDLAVQLLRNKSTYLTPDEQAAAIDRVTLAQVNEAIKKILSGPKAAMSVVGMNANEIAPVDVLLSA